MEDLGTSDPRRIGPYTLRARLGQGGMGRVFLGRSPSGRAVAVKVIHEHLARQTDFRRRFAREVASVRAVSGAFTAPLVGAGPEDDAPWLATVYVPGPSLAEAVAEAGPFPLESLWPLAAGLAEGLQDIHAARVVHRDLKPANVLLAADGPRVIDFGIARALDHASLTPDSVVIGTPGYISPEQIGSDELGPGSDVFTLGLVLAFAATGQSPFGEGPPLAMLHRILHDDARLDGVPAPLRGLVAACLAKEPAGRPTPPEVLRTVTASWHAPEQWPGGTPWPARVTELLPRHRLTDPGPRSAGALPPTREELTLRYTRIRQNERDQDPTAAARQMEQLAADQARFLGPDHPDTLQSRHMHAFYLDIAGQPAQAARLMAGVLADRKRILGADHEETLRSGQLHALSLGKGGDHAEAARLLAQNALDRARVLGPDHRSTLWSRHLHAEFVHAAGDHAQARRLMAGVVADLTRVLGPDHPATRSSRHVLENRLPVDQSPTTAGQQPS
ncbi:serine/threonine-protein kinase [Streptomyces sp. NRRL S-340]|uniref:serine/threonine-protein kinase n=1 Tax=Streptomyces sp. NRRL S-340 TaxID=1463901 RepID=UPI0007C54A26|nr:serine/threonine-protein kinase [Streptomyces sp. NRRL S-340]